MSRGKFFAGRAVILLAGAVGLVWFLIPLGWGVWNVGNALGAAVCAVLVAGALLYGRIIRTARQSRAFRACFTAVSVLLGAGAVWAAAMTVCMVSVQASPPLDTTAVVLGSMVQGSVPSADLWERIRAAETYLKANPNAKCIASGGTGSGESVSEASAIRDALVADGVGPERILLEDTSRSTKENLRNSRLVAQRAGLADRFAVVTDDYHEFRACLIARSLGAEAYAVPGRTPWYILSACWAREVLALAKYFAVPG